MPLRPAATAAALAAALTCAPDTARTHDTDTVFMTRLTIAWLRDEATCGEAMEIFRGAGDDDTFAATAKELLVLMIVAQAQVLDMPTERIGRLMADRCLADPESPFIGF